MITNGMRRRETFAMVRASRASISVSFPFALPPLGDFVQDLAGWRTAALLGRQTGWRPDLEHSIAGCQPGTSDQVSRTNVTSTVTRYSAIFPPLTLALCSITCRPVMLRSVLLARSSPSLTAALKLSVEAAVIFETLSTAI